MRLAYILFSAALLPAALAAPSLASAPGELGRSNQERAISVSLDASSLWVKKHDTVTLSGKVRGVRARTIVTIYQKNIRRGSDWIVETRKRTTRTGKFRHAEDINTGDRKYKACAKGQCSPAITVRMGTPPPPLAEPTAVTLGSISVTSAEAGVPFTVSGSATNLDGHAVQVQAYDASTTSWGAVGSAVVSSGEWSATATVTTAGRSLPIRARFPGATGLDASASGSTSLDVYGWYYLYDGAPDEVASDEAYGGQLDYGSWNVNGVTYSKSLGIGGGTGYTNWIEYDLSRACNRLAATVGMDDAAGTATRATARINVDSVNKWTQSGLQLGQSYPVMIDLTNGLRLHFETTETTNGAGVVVFGDVRALCAF